jgi:hypothetical protein
VDKHELLLRTVQGLVREGASPLLRDDAGVAELLDLPDHRQSAHMASLPSLCNGSKWRCPNRSCQG